MSQDVKVKQAILDELCTLIGQIQGLAEELEDLAVRVNDEL